MRVAFLTLGCKVNSYETEKMKINFEKKGHMVVAFEEKADVYIINTCTVTNIADRKSRKMLHRAKRLNPEAIIVATGCYVDSAKAKGEVDESVDLFISNSEKDDLVEIVLEKLYQVNGHGMEYNNSRKVLLNETSHSNMSQAAIDEEHTRAYIKIQDGCNQFCTYCIIPYVRGPLRSKSVDKITDEVKKLSEQGYKEIVVTGIHLSSYGVNGKKSGAFLEKEGKPLLEALEAINRVPGIERIRLGSLEPRIITDEFVKRLSQISAICPHFHLSLQSGSDSVLKRMNRHYTSAQYLEGVRILEKYFENPAVTTDIIVGFPMETEDEFEETLEFTEKVRFAQIHVFKYSRRQGTVADKMDGQITESEKSVRSERLITKEKILEREYMDRALKKEEKVLFEEVTEINGKKYITGYNERYIRIAVNADNIEDSQNKCNKIISVGIIGKVNDDVVLGEINDNF